MSPSQPADDKPLDPDQARMVGKMKLLMALSGGATLLGIVVVLGIVGYRVSRGDGRPPADVTVQLPKGARVVQTAVTEDRIVVTLETPAGPELRIFDAGTLRPAGRIRFANEP